MKAVYLAIALLAPLASQAATSLPQSGDLVEVAGQAVVLRSSTPDSFMGEHGAQVGWIRTGESMRVLETKQYVSMFGTEVWVEVQKADDSTVHGWVLDGVSNQMGSAALRVTAAVKPSTAAPASVADSAIPEDPRDAAAQKASRESDRLVKELLTD